MTSSTRVARNALATMALVVLAVSGVGCSAAKQAPRYIPEVRIPPGVSTEVAQDLARGLEQATTPREAASAALVEAGLDFACTYGNADEGVEAAVKSLKEEVSRRTDLTRDEDGLEAVHDAYSDAFAGMVLLSEQEAFAAGTLVIGTYCTIDKVSG